jgi:hypothetical protein
MIRSTAVRTGSIRFHRKITTASAGSREQCRLLMRDAQDMQKAPPKSLRSTRLLQYGEH